MLRRILLASAGVMALSGVALAAEPLPPPPPLPPPYSWAGIYIGVTAGYDQATHNFDDVNGLGAFVIGSGFNDTGAFRTSGFIGGGTLGINWQAGTFVYGLETDFSGLTNSTTVTLNTFLFDDSPFFSSRVNWLWTIRPRIGLAVDRTLVYFTAGFALAGVHNTFGTAFCGTDGCDGDEFLFSSGSTRVGYAVGGGVEYALTPNWSVKGEALYLNFGSRTSTFTTGSNFSSSIANVAFPERFDASMVVVRAGLNYKFTWAPAPVVAKY